MPKAYFDPNQLSALGAVLDIAKRLLNQHGVADLEAHNNVAHLILSLASKGMLPNDILEKVILARPDHLSAGDTALNSAASEKNKKEAALVPDASLLFHFAP